MTRHLIHALDAVGPKRPKLRIVGGTDYQRCSPYIRDLCEASRERDMAALAKLSDIRREMRARDEPYHPTNPEYLT